MLLSLKDICKSYPQGKEQIQILKNINLEVEEGEYLAIMGPSGSGKTTLMNIIGCLDRPTSGSYYLDGKNILKIREGAMSKVRLEMIGFVFQSFYLMPKQSAVENVSLPLLYAKVPKRKRKKMAAAMLEKVGLGERLKYKPSQLSGGQCQRVAIARALVNHPKLILADEPTGALDSKSGKQIMELFARLHEEGTTIVMITHDANIAKQAKRVVMILDGELKEEQSLPDSGDPDPGQQPQFSGNMAEDGLSERNSEKESREKAITESKAAESEAEVNKAEANKAEANKAEVNKAAVMESCK